MVDRINENDTCIVNSVPYTKRLDYVCVEGRKMEGRLNDRCARVVKIIG